MFSFARKRKSIRRRTKRPTRKPLAELLEDRRLLAAAPSVALNVSSEVMIGEATNVTVSFDNTDLNDPGFGPFIDVYLPRNGTDGVNGAGVDGISYVPGSATYLGTPVNATLVIFPDDGGGTGTVNHPYAVDATGTPLQVSGPAGDQLLVFELPFGSFTADQPPADITFDVDLSNLADLSVPLALRSRAGFRYGNDAVDNPATDPTLVSQVATAANSWTPQSSVTPTLVELSKSYSGPEDETATGPNFPRRWQIDIDVADGQTLTDVDVTDLLPGNIQLLSVDTITPAGTTTNFPVTPASPPNNELTVNIPTIVGTTTVNDATIVFSYFVPFRDASAANVNSPVSGDDVPAANNVSLLGDWTPIDGRDAGGTDNVSVDEVGDEHVVTAKSIAVQKSIAMLVDAGGAGYSGGDLVQYTIDFQISDFFAFDSITLNDVLSDGQRFFASPAPTLTVIEHGLSSAGNISPANYTVTDHFTGGSPPVGPIDGTQEISFDISGELVLRGGDSTVLGGLIPVGGTGGSDPDSLAFNGGATTGRLVFQAIVQEEFTDTFPSGDPSVDEGDLLTNDATVSGTVLNYATLAAEETEADSSSSSLEIARGVLSKSIYAINSNTTLPVPLQLTPGDEITYRLQLTLPNSDIENLQIDDYLPLPILSATEVTTFVDAVNAAVPPAGQAKFGPDDTFRAIYGTAPGWSTDATSNRVAFNYGDFDTDPSVSSEIDLLFTVTASSDPFADGLYLTNQVRRTQGSTNQGSVANDAIIPIQLGEPELNVSKGVVATSNVNSLITPGAAGPVSFTPPGTPGYRGSATIHSTGLAASPIDSNLSLADAGDLVTFAIVVENTGSSRRGAFDIQLRDTMPAGFVVPAGGLNMSVTDGTGATIGTTNMGTGLFDPGGGIELNDPGPTTPVSGTDGGALDEFDPLDGQNILIITYDLEVGSAAVPLQTLTNTATLFNYAGSESGPDFSVSDLTDPASAQIAPATVGKSLLSTSEASTSGNDVAIGEIATYQSTITVPEGTTPSMVWTDAPTAGLAILDVTSVTPSSGDLSAAPGSFAAITAGATIPADGSSVMLDFGDITNANRDDTIAETINVVYLAVVLNQSGNDRTGTLDNQAQVAWTGGSRNIDGPDLTIVEPELSVVKTITPASGQANDVFSVTIDVAHTAASDAGAFDVGLTDVLPAGLTYFGGAPTSTGLTPTALSESGGTVTATWNAFPDDGSTAQIQFMVQAAVGVVPGTTVTNTANASWSSLPGDVTTPQSSNGLSVERTGDPSDPGGTENDYRASGNDTVAVVLPAVTKTLTGTNQAHTLSANVGIGEIATYEVEIQVPQGTMTGTQFIDTPDAGLAIVDVVTVTSSAAVSTSVGTMTDVRNNAVVAADGSSVTLDFQTLTNSDAAAGVTETVTITYRAVILNTTTNDRGDVLDNQGTLNWGVASSINVDGPDLTIVEPELSVTVSDSTPALADAGDTLQFTIDIAHTGASNADAFNVDLENLINSVSNHLQYVPGSINITGSGGAVLGVSSDVSGYLSVDWTVFPLGATAQVTFDVVIENSAPAATTLTNDAEIWWTSLPADVTTPQSSNGLSTERTGRNADPGAGANDHTDTENGIVTTRPPGSSKVVLSTNLADTTDVQHDPAITDIAIGEEVTYRVTMWLPEGTNTLVVTDQLPNGPGVLELLSASVARVGAQLTAAAPTITITDSATDADTLNDLVVLDFGTVVNLPDGIANLEDQIEVDVVARLVDVPGNVDATVLANTATITVSGAITVADVDVEIVEPGLEIDKSSPTTTGPAGTTMPFTVTIQHAATSTANAHDVAIADLFSDPNLTLVPGSVTTDRGSITSGNGATDTTVGITLPTLALGESVTVTFDGVVDPSLASAVGITNTSTLDYDSLPGAGGRTGNDSDPHAFNTTAPEIDLVLTKVESQDPTVISGPLAYTLVVTNNGPSTATSVILTDNLPAGLTGISATTTQGGVGVAGLVVTGNIGTLLPGASATVEIFVTTPAVDGTITNNASVTATETDTNVADNSASEPTVVLGVSSISGTSWVDTNSDGIVDAGEVLLPGVSLTLTGVDDLGNTVLLTTTTDASGNYRFSTLRPGTYQVTQTQPTLFVDNADYIGTQGGAPLSNDVTEIVLPAGVDALDYHFTELGIRPELLGKRRLLNSRLRQGSTLVFDDFVSIFAPGGGGDLDGDSDVDHDDFLLFQDRLGEAFAL